MLPDIFLDHNRFTDFNVYSSIIFGGEGVSCSIVSNSLQSLSSVLGILQARILDWVAIPFSRGISPTQDLNAGLPQCRQILYSLSHWEAHRADGIDVISNPCELPFYRKQMCN